MIGGCAGVGDLPALPLLWHDAPHLDHLTTAQLEVLRTRLLEERRRVLDRAQAGQAENLTYGGDSGDVQDAGADDMRRSLGATSIGRDRLMLAEIAAALARMEDGSYGLCEESGDPIPFRRLESEPTARYTVEAQEALEAEQLIARRTQIPPDSEAY